MRQEQLELAGLSIRIQVAYLATCIEHLRPLFVSEQTLDAMLRLAWEFAIDTKRRDDEITAIVATLDELLDEDVPAELSHLVSAAELLITSLADPSKVAIQLWNNIEGAIDVVDTDEGMEEEQQWQQRALGVAKQLTDSSLGRSSFDAISGEEMKWLQRVTAMTR